MRDRMWRALVQPSLIAAFVVVGGISSAEAQNPWGTSLFDEADGFESANVQEIYATARSPWISWNKAAGGLLRVAPIVSSLLVYPDNVCSLNPYGVGAIDPTTQQCRVPRAGDKHYLGTYSNGTLELDSPFLAVRQHFDLGTIYLDPGRTTVTLRYERGDGSWGSRVLRSGWQDINLNNLRRVRFVGAGGGGGFFLHAVKFRLTAGYPSSPY